MSETTDKIKYLGMQGTKALLEGLKGEYSPLGHEHSDLIESINKITNGSTTVSKAEEAVHSSTADTATEATHAITADEAIRATQDGNGNVIVDTYALKEHEHSDILFNLKYNENRLSLIYGSKNFEIIRGNISDLLSHEIELTENFNEDGSSGGDIPFYKRQYLFNIDKNLNTFSEFDYYFIQMRLPYEGSIFYSQHLAQLDHSSMIRFDEIAGVIIDNTSIFVKLSANKIYAEGSNSTIEEDGKCCLTISPLEYLPRELYDKISDALSNAEIVVYLARKNWLSLDNKIEYEPTKDYNPATKKYVDDNIGLLMDGSTPVSEATHSSTADEATHALSADVAIKTEQDGNGNIITDTYETKSDAEEKLTEAMEYTDTSIPIVPIEEIVNYGASIEITKDAELPNVVYRDIYLLSTFNTPDKIFACETYKDGKVISTSLNYKSDSGQTTLIENIVELSGGNKIGYYKFETNAIDGQVPSDALMPPSNHTITVVNVETGGRIALRINWDTTELISKNSLGYVESINILAQANSNSRTQSYAPSAATDLVTKQYVDGKAVVVDSSLDQDSTNPVENQAITNWLANNVKQYRLVATAGGSGYAYLSSDNTNIAADAPTDGSDIETSYTIYSLLAHVNGVETDVLLGTNWESIKNIPIASTSKQGIVQLTDSTSSTSTSTAATPNSVKQVYDLAKAYADTAATTVKNDLLNGAGEAYDTLIELGDLINENTTALDALEEVATGKADADHTHSWNDLTNKPFEEVDSEISAESENPVQNKVVKEYIDSSINNIPSNLMIITFDTDNRTKDKTFAEILEHINNGGLVYAVSQYSNIYTLDYYDTQSILFKSMYLTDATTSVIAESLIIHSSDNISFLITNYSLKDYVKKSGSTMTGSLILANNPTENLEAATKQYVDAIIPTQEEAVTLMSELGFVTPAGNQDYVLTSSDIEVYTI